MAIQRVFASVLTDRLQESRDFWVEILGFGVAFDSNWFVRLSAIGDASLEIGLVQRSHETIPAPFRLAPGGTLITVVVEDVDAVHIAAVTRGVEVLEPPTDMFYGQRRMLLISPSGQLVDVSTVLDRESTEVDM